MRRVRMGPEEVPSCRGREMGPRRCTVGGLWAARKRQLMPQPAPPLSGERRGVVVGDGRGALGAARPAQQVARGDAGGAGVCARAEHVGGVLWSSGPSAVHTPEHTPAWKIARARERWCRRTCSTRKPACGPTRGLRGCALAGNNVWMRTGDDDELSERHAHATALRPKCGGEGRAGRRGLQRGFAAHRSRRNHALGSGRGERNRRRKQVPLAFNVL